MRPSLRSRSGPIARRRSGRGFIRGDTDGVEFEYSEASAVDDSDEDAEPKPGAEADLPSPPSLVDLLSNAPHIVLLPLPDPDEDIGIGGNSCAALESESGNDAVDSGGAGR